MTSLLNLYFKVYVMYMILFLNMVFEKLFDVKGT